MSIFLLIVSTGVIGWVYNKDRWVRSAVRSQEIVIQVNYSMVNVRMLSIQSERSGKALISSIWRYVGMGDDVGILDHAVFVFT